MAYRRSHATARFRQEIDRHWPARSKTSDGWIGDAAHRSRKSDHNPNSAGVVQAEDITNHNGLGSVLWEHLLRSRDPRIKYVIFNYQMFSSYPSGGVAPWTPRPYNGSNPHATHLHLSVQDDSSLYDDASSWGLNTKTIEEDDVFVVKYGESGPRVKRVQKILQAAGKTIGYSNLLQEHGIDGDYGDETRNAVNRFAKRAGLDEEGNAGMDVLVLDYCRNMLSQPSENR